MYIVFGTDKYNGEVYGKGVNLEEAIADIESLADDVHITEYYWANSLNVEKTVTYNIIE